MNNTSSASPTPTRKRTHLKPSQVAILQESFNNNPLPDSSVRSRLARELAVTERTIQIWFQNRRAKARKLEALHSFAAVGAKNTATNASLLRGAGGWVDPSSNSRHATPPRYQATFRTMMTPERFEELKQQDNQHIRRRPRSISKPEPKSSSIHISRQNDARAMSEGLIHRRHHAASSSTMMTTSVGQTSMVNTPLQMVPLHVSVLRIGSWTRFAHASPHTHQREWDLVCYSSPQEREFVWKVQAEGHHFRIQVGFDNIQQLRLSQQIQMETGELVGQLGIELTLPLMFSMWRFGQDHEWVRCGDFTEDKQASVDGIHILQGSYEAFKQALLDLIAYTPELAAKVNVLPTTAGMGPNALMMDLSQTVAATAPTTTTATTVTAVPPPPLDLCRDFTMSPSATPEPTSLAAMSGLPQQHMMYHGNVPYGMINPQHLSKTNMSHLMLQAPFFYPSQTSSSATTSATTATETEDLYPLMQPSDLLLPQTATPVASSASSILM